MQEIKWQSNGQIAKPSIQTSFLELFHTQCLPDMILPLKDKSGVDKIIVKKQHCQLLNTNREFFPSLDASTFHNWLMNPRKLGQYRRHFVFCTSVRSRDKEASNVSGIISTHLVASFKST